MAANINQGITDLTTAVSNLATQASVLDATLSTRIGQLVTSINNIPPGCGCPTMGTETPTGDVVEDDPPPDGYEEWDPGIDDRKCKLANMIFDDILNITEILIANDVENIAGLGAGAMGALLGMVLAVLLSGPLAWGLAALGAIAGLIAFFLLQSVNLGTLEDLLTDNQEDLVCALYISTSSQGGLDAFKDVLSVAGANAAMLAYLDALQMLSGMAVLYFQPEGAMGVEINQRLDGYPMTIDCSVCVFPIGPMDWVIAPDGTFGWSTGTGHLGTGAIFQDGSDFIITTAVATSPTPGAHVLCLILDAEIGAGVTCMGEAGVLRIVSSPGGYASNSGLQCVDWTWCGNPAFQVGMPATGPSTGMVLMIRAWVGGGPRQVTFRVDTPPTICP